MIPVKVIVQYTLPNRSAFIVLDNDKISIQNF